MLHDLFLNATVVITAITVGNFLFKGPGLKPKLSVRFKISSGIAGGLLGILLMIYGVHVSQTAIMDFRNIPIVMVTVYGGIISGTTAGVIIGFFRLLYFGINRPSIVAFIAALLMGYSCGLISKMRFKRKLLWALLTVYTTTISSIGFAIIMVGKPALGSILVTYCIGCILVSSFAYMFTKYLGDHNRLFNKLKSESAKDFLTGLNNVRQFNHLLNNIMVESVKSDIPISLLFIDIDFFKKINDTYGHASGDTILKQLGSILKGCCRNCGIISRNGGDEFSVILPGYSLSYAFEVAKRVCTAVQCCKFSLPDGSFINITLSIGISSCPGTTSIPEMLLAQADSALYKAKLMGRNRIVKSDIAV